MSTESWTPAPLSSPLEDLLAAKAAIEADEHGYEPLDPFAAWFIDRVLERAERREFYRQHHPAPLPINGHEYHRRRKARR